jgi:hypothetical protein
MREKLSYRIALAMTAGIFLGPLASAQTFAIHCAEPTHQWTEYDFTIDTQAGSVSYTWSGRTVSPQAQITSQSIDWTLNDNSPPVPGSQTFHIDRTSGVMQTDWNFPGAAHPTGSVTYRCTKDQGF